MKVLNIFPTSNWSINRSEIYIWVVIMVLNCLLFLPIYLLSMDGSTFIPYNGIFEDLIYDKFRYYFRRYNLDIFRLSVDILVMVGVLFWVRKSNYIKIISRVFTLAYLLFFMYQVYSGFFYVIYKIPPVFYNDFPFIKNGAIELMEQIDWFWLFFIIPISIFILFIKWLFFKLTLLFRKQPLRNYSKIMIMFLCIYASMSILRYGYNSTPQYGVQTIGIALAKNVKGSIKLSSEIEKIDPAIFDSFNSLYGFKLDKPDLPDIVVIFIESYGKIMIDDEKINDGYKKLMNSNQELLKNRGFNMASALSLAPITGGGSWLSYTTFNMGFKMASQGIYFNYLNNLSFHKYLNFFRWLNLQGYRSYWLNSLYEPDNYSIPWEKYSSFYAVDEWIRFEDLQYDGPLYGFGPAPPDQYALNKSLENIHREQKHPYSLFFITKNSHSPFGLPYLVKEDWRDWNSEEGADHPARFFKKPEIENYAKAIHFQINYIAEIIAKSKNKLFIIIGDHQPPVLNTYGFETFVHIISKNQALVDGFMDYGFTKGLLVEPKDYHIKHEGLYSMILREMKRQYATDSMNLPPYLPDGIIFNQVTEN